MNVSDRSDVPRFYPLRSNDFRFNLDLARWAYR